MFRALVLAVDMHLVVSQFHQTPGEKIVVASDGSISTGDDGIEQPTGYISNDPTRVNRQYERQGSRDSFIFGWFSPTPKPTLAPAPLPRGLHPKGGDPMHDTYPLPKLSSPGDKPMSGTYPLPKSSSTGGDPMSTWTSPKTKMHPLTKPAAPIDPEDEKTNDFPSMPSLQKKPVSPAGTAGLWWNKERLQAETKQGDKSKCYVALFGGEVCDSEGGVYLVSDAWYDNHYGGSFKNLGSCGTIVADWLAISLGHSFYKSALSSRSDLGDHATYVTDFDC